MGFQLPSALAGDNDEVELNEEGARRVIRLIGGTALGAMILGAGGMLYNKISSRFTDNNQLGDLY
jgi:hypothetical protein